MTVDVYSTSDSFDTHILAGDVGGTNANLALVGRHGDEFITLAEVVVPSAEVTNFDDVVVQALDTIRSKLGVREVRACSISAAGPVGENRCVLTNQGWTVDGASLQANLGIPTQVINDFLALSYGIPLLNPGDPNEVRALTRDRSPRSHAPIMVLGAGTGLGFGFLTFDGKSYQAHPSEGGHVDFAPSTVEEAEMAMWWASRLGEWPSAERFVAGPGIGRIFEFLHARGDFGSDSVAEEVAALGERERAPRVALDAAHGGPTGLAVMQRFVNIYGKYAGSMANVFLPYGGVFIAGGIVAKNVELFTKDDQFMRSFRRNDAPGCRKYLGEFPVFAVMDYSISLRGAAAAASHVFADGGDLL